MSTLEDFYPAPSAGIGGAISTGDLLDVRYIGYDTGGAWDGTPTPTDFNRNTVDAVTENIGGRDNVQRLYDPETDILLDTYAWYQDTTNAGTNLSPEDKVTFFNEVSLYDMMGWLNWTAFDTTSEVITAPNHGFIDHDSTSDYLTLIVIDPVTGLQQDSSAYYYYITDANTLTKRGGDNNPALAAHLASGYRLYSRRIHNLYNHPIFNDLTGLTITNGYRFIPVGPGAVYGMGT